MLASRLFFLMILGCESGCLGLKNQAFGNGGIAKINFTGIGLLMIPGSIFDDSVRLRARVF